MAASVASEAAALLSRTSREEWISAITLIVGALSHEYFHLNLGVRLFTPAIQILAYPLSAITYNLFFHPLKHYPGPRAHAATSIPWGLSLLRGRLPADVLSLHEAYGPVVRIRPNELAFANAPAWQDIYGHKVAGKRAGLAPGVKELPKYQLFYKAHPRQPSSLVTALQDDHSKWRRITAPGFSDKSLKGQEPLVMRYVDLLMMRLKERTGEVVDLMVWYNWTTFDIIGNLAFGGSFGCLEQVKYHPFIDRVCKSLRQSSRLVLIRYMGLQRLAYFALSILFRKGFVVRNVGGDTLKKRLENKEPRPDLVEPLIQAKDEGLLDQATLSTMATGFLLAGSETTASSLSGVTWLLLSNPDKLEKLTREVREAFKEESDINFSSVQCLEYTLACLNESLRLYPPIAMGLPRQVPEGGAVISGGYVPEGVSG